MHMRNAITMVGLVSALALSACGGDKGDNLGRFVGTWRATAGTITTACPGYTPSTDPVTDGITWSLGVSSDLVATGADCAIMANVAGFTAMGAPGVVCSGAVSDGLVATLTLTSYTFVVSPDGHTATENESGGITYVADGATIPCTFNETASYQKIGN
jgi:hypothetical protein